MLSARSPLSVKNENTVSSQMSNMSLDKENTVRLRAAAALMFNVLLRWTSVGLKSSTVFNSKLVAAILWAAQPDWPRYHLYFSSDQIVNSVWNYRKLILVSDEFLSFLFQPPSLNTTRILASKTARKIFDEPAVSESKPAGVELTSQTVCVFMCRSVRSCVCVCVFGSDPVAPKMSVLAPTWTISCPCWFGVELPQFSWWQNIWRVSVDRLHVASFL